METVNHPPHYAEASPKYRPILSAIGVKPEMMQWECIQAIEKLELGFHEGNAVKYLWRAEYKGNELEDLKKALWYLDRMGGTRFHVYARQLIQAEIQALEA